MVTIYNLDNITYYMIIVSLAIIALQTMYE